MSEVYLNRTGCLFTRRGQQLLPVNEDDMHAETKMLLRQLSRSPYACFYKTPFERLAYASGQRLLGDFSMTPGDFNPGSAFDAIYSAHAFVVHGKLVFPRLYLYPTSVCNSQCKLCQFHERHKERTSLRSEDMQEALRVLQRHKGYIREQCLIVSGDGEPMLYPHLQSLLEMACLMKLRVFLTTNLLKPFAGNEPLYRAIAQTSAMITVSVKGLSPETYAEQQGLKGTHWFEQVMDNLNCLIKLREQLGRTQQCLIGVASLILPENSGDYRNMIDRLHEMGVDYFYLNQVEPSLDRWGITFSEEEKQQTLQQLSEYGQSPYHDMVVRCAAAPFAQRHGSTVYYNAAKERIHPDVCGSALFNPLVLSEKGRAIWLSCRNSDLFGKEAFRYETQEDAIPQHSIKKVMAAASGCQVCRLERQVKHFDKIIDIERSNIPDREYYLVFDTEKILSGSYSFIHFESVVK